MQMETAIIILCVLVINVVNSVVEADKNLLGKQLRSNEIFVRASLPPVQGPCESYTPRYYFNLEKMSCEVFAYGGCKGNSNRFETAEACFQFMTSVKRTSKWVLETAQLPPIPGKCMAVHRHFYYHKPSRRCKKFNYGGCGGNANRFEEFHDCAQFAENFQIASNCLKLVAAMAPETGPCRIAERRQYMDLKRKSCRGFTYGGCKGNANNFYTKQDCQNFLLYMYI